MKTDRISWVPMSTSRARRMATVHDKVSATAPLARSMLFQSLAGTMRNQRRQIVSRPIRNRLAAIGAASSPSMATSFLTLEGGLTLNNGVQMPALRGPEPDSVTVETYRRDIPE